MRDFQLSLSQRQAHLVIHGFERRYTMKIHRSTVRLFFLFFVIASFSGLFVGQAAYSQERNRAVPPMENPQQMMGKRSNDARNDDVPHDAGDAGKDEQECPPA
jgi:hypothetical protein